MKDLSILRYYNEYLWVRIEHNIITVGISKFAAQQWGSIVTVQLPFWGKFFKQGDVFGVAESLHTHNQLPMPIDGIVLKTNAVLETNPALLNTDPMGEGWILKIRAVVPEQLDNLLTESAYLQIIKL